ncbi:hypothetical protein DL96DRAFT_1720658 [Flagelloscypha sp. PMI_526]|nr:hypothetical protein DL96DRAFT_1720658 [Flagelloscypha sp. PMI_526]
MNMKAPQLTYFLLLVVARLTSAAPTGFGAASDSVVAKRKGICNLVPDVCKELDTRPNPLTRAPTPTEIGTVQETGTIHLGPRLPIFAQA